MVSVAFGEQTHTAHTSTKRDIEVGPVAPSGWLGGEGLVSVAFGEQTHTMHTSTKRDIEVGPVAPPGWLGGEGLLCIGLCASLGLLVV